MNCLLQVDKSEEVVGDAVLECLAGYKKAQSKNEAVADTRNGRLYWMIEMLLKANPEAATFRNSDGDNILHAACSSSVPSAMCIDIVKLVLVHQKGAMQEADDKDRLPVHCAVISCDVEVVESLLGLYPEAAGVVTPDGDNLLHLAVDDDASRAVPKVRYLCSRYPAMIQQTNCDGDMPVHMACETSRFQAALALYEAGGIEQFKTPITHPTDATYEENGRLPLHVFIRNSCSPIDTTSEAADMFRWLLRLYPEAAGIEGGVGAHKSTPYQLAVVRKLPGYYLRLMLRAAPTLYPAVLRRLNYAERRMAMFLAFKATTARLQKPFLLARLRGVNKGLARSVVSFL